MSLLLLSLLVILILGLCSRTSHAGRQSRALAVDVCLHAQVSPTEKVVGSVVTTDGMRAALSARADVNSVQIFYPFHYSNFVESNCDLVLIEGWFPSIHSFIALSRVLTPHAVVLFYCLDPVYPGMSRVNALDVDGYLTNSKALLADLLMIRPTMYVPLAADIELMRPDPSVPREYGAVYVGAGGNMLNVKPLLLEMLHRSITYGLRLHGAHWDVDPLLAGSYKGVLPRGTLHKAYSSAHAVLACTISSQRDMGMINNRIFEALACGSVVITDYSDILNDTFGEVLQFVHEPSDVNDIFEQLMNVRNDNYFQSIRKRGRELIESGHTWSHRVIEILDFFSSLRSESSMILDNSRAMDISTHASRVFKGECGSSDKSRDESSSSEVSVPLLAWVVSDHLLSHPDYLLSVHRSIDLFFQSKYIVHQFTAFEFVSLLQSAAGQAPSTDYKDALSPRAALQLVSQYSIIFGVMSHFDDLHMGFISFHQWHSNTNGNLAINVKNQTSSQVLDRTQQKYVAFVLGVDEKRSVDTLDKYLSSEMDNRGIYLSELFDMILFRDLFEKELVSSIEEASQYRVLKQVCEAYSNVAKDDRNKLLLQSAFQNRSCDFPIISKNDQEIKWQICFGVWERGKTTSDLTDRADADVMGLKNVALCLWSQWSFCIAKGRTKYIATNVNYTLLLLGGSLADWTSSCDIASDGEGSNTCVLDAISLAQVLHVRDGNAERVFDVLSQATEIFFLYDENLPKNSSPSGYMKRTGLDVIWPLLFGAVFNKSMRLSEQPAAHISYLIENEAWHTIPVLQQWQRMLSVVLTFGTCKTSGRFIANYVNHIPKEDGEKGYSRAGDGSFFSDDKLMVFVHFTNFVPGLDGQACFFHDDIFSNCRYSREVYLLEVDLHKLPWTTEELRLAASQSTSAFVTKSTKLRVELRGFLYLQHFYVIEQTYVFCLPNPFHDSDKIASKDFQGNLCVNGTNNVDFDLTLQEQYLSSKY